MKQILPSQLMIYVGVLWLLAAVSTHAQQPSQRQYYNWYFGNGAGFTFLTTPISTLPLGRNALYGDISSLSDSAGGFQFVVEGNTVYNRQFQVMSGGQLGGPVVYGSQVMAVPQPGRPGRYYVFVPRQAFFPTPTLQSVPPNLTYFIIDMRRQGGLGEVVGRDSLVVVPSVITPFATTGGYIESDIAAVRHTNGRDLWLVVKNDQQQYLSYLVDRAGVHRQPVVTLNPVGRRLAVIGGLGLLKASTDGRTLAYSNFALLLNGRGNLTGQRLVYNEIARFDAQTGRVSSAYIIADSGRYRVPPNSWFGGGGGLELSPDGSRLYTDTLLSRVIWQYDLTAGSPAAVAASRTVVARPLSGFKGLSGALSNNLQLGPDGKVYHITTSARWVSRFEMPNALGSRAGFRDSVLRFTPGTTALGGLPHAPNDLGLEPVEITGAGSFGGGTICAGEPLAFASSLSPFVTAAAYTWNFGDPTSGPLNTASGQAPVHRFLLPGTFTVTLVVTASSGRSYTTSQLVQVWPRPVVDLGPDLLLCADEFRTLSVGPQITGSTYRWHDGSTSAELAVRLAGTYRVTVTSPQGCSTTDELTVQLRDCLQIPNIITPNGDGQNQSFVLKGLNATEWALRLYNRWGSVVYEREKYDNTWDATGQPDGVYYYLLANAKTGQQYKGWLEVRR